MRNLNDNDEESNNYDYSPNELADLSINNPKKFREIVGSNLDKGDTIERWQQRNLDYARKCLANQNRN